MENQEIEIIQLCQNGDLAQFGRLYDQYLKKIYDFIYYRTNHRETAEDLTSQTFIKALENINQFNPDKGSFSSWLYKIARNNIIDYWRLKKNKDSSLLIIKDAVHRQNLEAQIDDQAKLEKFWQFINRLSKEQREIVLMRVWDDLSYQEIAKITNKNPAAVKMMFYRIIKKLAATNDALLLMLFLLTQSIIKNLN